MIACLIAQEDREIGADKVNHRTTVLKVKCLARIVVVDIELDEVHIVATVYASVVAK